jgi:hypothetical protein
MNTNVRGNGAGTVLPSGSPFELVELQAAVRVGDVDLDEPCAPYSGN